MKRIVYVNGKYVNEDEAKISIFDRGFLFSDSVYEVTAVISGKLFENNGHLTRLKCSCERLEITLPVSLEDIEKIQKSLIEKNKLTEGAIYLQVTRGNIGDRDFHFPDKSVPASLILFTQARAVIQNPSCQKGIKAITVPEIRWKLRDIKATSLLAACLAKQEAYKKGANDAIFVKDGYITEGSSSNAYIVDQNGIIVTHNLNQDILHGITRRGIISLINESGFKLEERAFSVEELYTAREVFLSSATACILPITNVDGKIIGDGTPGCITKKLYKKYCNMALEVTK